MNITVLKASEILILLCIAAACDIKTYKIRNSITVPFMLLGMGTNIYACGIQGLVLSLLGWAAPVLLLFLLYALKMLGAGDIKLFAAIGSIAGIGFIFYSMALSFLCGGLMGLALMIFRRNAAVRIKYFAAYLKSCFLTFRLLDYSTFEDKGKGDKFHFSLAILAGTSLQLILLVFNKGGIP